MAVIISTKDQERKALARIRKMVEDLGPDSYLATAFAGCFEDAEINIENDFADSMKARYESAKENVDYFRTAANAFSDELDAAREEIKRLKTENDKLTLRLPSADDLTDCIALVEERVSKFDQQMNEAAERIVEFADEPVSPEFRQAVTYHRNEKGNFEYFKALQERLNNCIATRV